MNVPQDGIKKLWMISASEMEVDMAIYVRGAMRTAAIIGVAHTMHFWAVHVCPSIYIEQSPRHMSNIFYVQVRQIQIRKDNGTLKVSK